MSKIICDICGTSYPETAEQCPICGSVRPVDIQNVITDNDSGDKQSGYTYVKGGRFSKANVKKRNMEKQAAPVSEPEYSQPEIPEDDKTNTGLIVTAIVLFIAILALVGFILIRFFGVGDLFGDKTAQGEDDPVTTPSITETTEPTEPSETTDPIEIPCTGVKISGNTSNTIRFSAVGDTQILNITLTPANTTDSVEFISDDETVATVSSDGKVEAVGSGLTTILITCGDQMLECLVVCDFELPTEETTEPTEIQYTLEDLILKTYKDSGEITLAINEKVKIYYGNIPLDKVKLYTEDPSIATVDGDSVVGVKTGSTILYAEYGDLQVKCIIRVSAKQYGGLPGSGNVDNPG